MAKTVRICNHLKIDRLRAFTSFVLFLTFSFNSLAQIPTNGLKGYWQLNGNVLDASGNNNNGSLRGAAVYCPDRFGNANSAVRLGGFYNSSAIFVPNSASLYLTNKLTIACWFKLDGADGMDNNTGGYSSTNSWQVFVNKDGDRAGFVLLYRLFSGLEQSIFWNTNNTTCTNSADVGYYDLKSCINTEWIHTAVVVDSNSITMYINGRQKHRQTYSSQITFTRANSCDLSFGRMNNACHWDPSQRDKWYPLNGRLDDIVYYNRALSQEEIQALCDYPAVYITPIPQIISTITDNICIGEVYERNGFSLPAQNQLGSHEYSRTNGCDSVWVLQLDVFERISVCATDSVTLVSDFTQGGTSPAFQWFVNDTAFFGATDTVFTYRPNNGDTVRCRLINTDCVPSDTVFSHKIVITTIAPLAASVSISASDTSICAEIPVTFTAATPVNGGSSPTYQWVKNGVDIPFATSNTYTYAPENSDIITCKMTSSACAVPKPAISNAITMVIKPIRKPSITIKRIK